MQVEVSDHFFTMALRTRIYAYTTLYLFFPSSFCSLVRFSAPPPHLRSCSKPLRRISCPAPFLCECISGFIGVAIATSLMRVLYVPRSINIKSNIPRSPLLSFNVCTHSIVPFPDILPSFLPSFFSSFSHHFSVFFVLSIPPHPPSSARSSKPRNSSSPRLPLPPPLNPEAQPHSNNKHKTKSTNSIHTYTHATPLAFFPFYLLHLPIPPLPSELRARLAISNGLTALTSSTRSRSSLFSSFPLRSLPDPKLQPHKLKPKPQKQNQVDELSVYIHTYMQHLWRSSLPVLRCCAALAFLLLFTCPPENSDWGAAGRGFTEGVYQWHIHC